MKCVINKGLLVLLFYILATMSFNVSAGNCFNTINSNYKALIDIQKNAGKTFTYSTLGTVMSFVSTDQIVESYRYKKLKHLLIATINMDEYLNSKNSQKALKEKASVYYKYLRQLDEFYEKLEKDYVQQRLINKSFSLPSKKEFIELIKKAESSGALCSNWVLEKIIKNTNSFAGLREIILNGKLAREIANVEHKKQEAELYALAEKKVAKELTELERQKAQLIEKAIKELINERKQQKNHSPM